MILSLALFSLLQVAGPPAPAPPPDGPGYSGRSRQTTVPVPREDAAPVIDGALSEPVWARAAVLRDFTQFTPQDGIPAADSTQVLVWYSPSAIYFGIRAFESHAAVHATLADRDAIGADDNVQILLGTLGDDRQAAVFGVNPFGVQMDGVVLDNGTQTQGFGGTPPPAPAPDLSPDFVWQSKGRVTAWGYEVEIRIPFKSLRFRGGREQTWRLNVERNVQHSGYVDLWAPAVRGAASFLAQSGRLTGLTDLHRGLVVDLNPEVTSTRTGALDSTGYGYHGGAPQLGGNVRWGVTNNLTLNGTVHPDFSQVESDASQLGFDPRNALFFAEKRPFFLDGIEQFDTPNQLIYTRRILQPVGAAKLTGSAGPVNVAFLSAVDDPAASPTGAHPVYNLARAQRPLAGGSQLGVAYTDKIDGGTWNRVGDFDGRLVIGGAYALSWQLAGSLTHDSSGTVAAPLWQLRLDRNGKHFGWRTSFVGSGDRFLAASGFLARNGLVQAAVDPIYTVYGRRGAFIEQLSGNVLALGNWQYQHFVHGRGLQDRKLHFTLNARLRGGWNAGAGWFVESFGYDSTLYAGYYLGQPDGQGGTRFVPFTGQPTIPNSEYFLSLRTPSFKWGDANLFVLHGHDENFPEWASGRLTLLNGGFNLRPSDQLRIGFTYSWQQVNRRTDGSLVSVGRIPRLKIEYQLARPIFVRLIGEYTMTSRDSLRDNSRTELPIYFADGQGGFTQAAAQSQNLFRLEFLFSYRPTPGTVFYAGYGSLRQEPEAFRFDGLTRVSETFFAKMSYLFRM